MKSFCEKCNKLVDYNTSREMVCEDGIEYLGKYDECLVCGNRFYSEDTHNYNVNNYSNEVRKANGIITIQEINEILNKYNIGKKPLSLVLGFGEITIIRYLDGQMPEKVYSDILKKVLEDSNEMLKYLEENKNLITSAAYKKVIGKIASIKLEEDKSKIYLISKHIIAKIGDITPLALQKILYYIQGFSLAILDYSMFDNRCEAWVHGPVYREIYDRFSYYSYNSIDEEEFSGYDKLDNMSEEEIKLIDSVINNFGCYSGKTLEKMTHITLPWVDGRDGLLSDEASSNEITIDSINDYFKNIVLKYNINNSRDISKYSRQVFKDVNK